MAKTKRLVHPNDIVNSMWDEVFVLVPLEDRDFKVYEPEDEPQTPKCKSKCKKRSTLAEEHLISKARVRNKRNSDAAYKKNQSNKRNENKKRMTEVREELSGIQRFYANLRRDKERLTKALKAETNLYEQEKIRYTINQIDIDICRAEYSMALARRTPGKTKQKALLRNKANNEVAISKLKEYYASEDESVIATA